MWFGHHWTPRSRVKAYVCKNTYKKKVYSLIIVSPENSFYSAVGDLLGHFVVCPPPPPPIVRDGGPEKSVDFAVGPRQPCRAVNRFDFGFLAGFPVVRPDRRRVTIAIAVRQLPPPRPPPFRHVRARFIDNSNDRCRWDPEVVRAAGDGRRNATAFASKSTKSTKKILIFVRFETFPFCNAFGLCSRFCGIK